MQVTLTETEVKQAITDYLYGKFIANIDVESITITAGPKSKDVITQVEISTSIRSKYMEEIQKVVEPKAKEPVPEDIPVAIEPVTEEPKVEVPKTKVKAVKESAEAEDLFGEVAVPMEEEQIVEGENKMTENFDIPVAEPEAEPIVDDVEDLFAC